jgi:hypothetical protein
MDAGFKAFSLELTSCWDARSMQTAPDRSEFFNPLPTARNVLQNQGVQHDQAHHHTGRVRRRDQPSLTGSRLLHASLADVPSSQGAMSDEAIGIAWEPRDARNGVIAISEVHSEVASESFVSKHVGR